MPDIPGTITYSDLMGNEKIYYVPPYQRDYSWEEEEWDLDE